MKDLVSIKISREVFEALQDEQHERRKKEGKVSQDEIVRGWYESRSGVQQIPQTGDAPNNANLLISELQDLRRALRRSIEVLDRTLSDVDVSHEELAEVGREVDQIDSDSGDVGEDSRHLAENRRNVAPHGVKLKQGRRAQ